MDLSVSMEKQREPGTLHVKVEFDVSKSAF